MGGWRDGGGVGIRPNTHSNAERGVEKDGGRRREEKWTEKNKAIHTQGEL